MEQKEIIDVLNVAQEIDRQSGIEEIVGLLSAYLERYGLTACLITQLPLRDQPRWDDYILANCWPPEWYRHYKASGHFREDPCVARCRHTAAPFLWSDVEQAGLTLPARLVMQEAKEFGLHQGICVPYHAPFVPPLVVTVSGAAADLPPNALQVIGLLAHQSLHSALSADAGPGQAPSPVLSEREREVLRWVADGKTAWEISRILSLSEHTVLSHQRNARQKLDAANNVHAVVKAFLRQEIQP